MSEEVKKPRKLRAPKEPQVEQAKVDSPTNVPKGDPIDESYLVISGYSKKPIGDHYPYVTGHRIARALKLDPRKCRFADERETEKIARWKAEGRKVVTVEDLP